MERYFAINEEGHNIRCKLYFDKLPDIKKVVLFLHGFAGHKDNAAAAKFAERLLTKYKGIAVMVFNWPCHGDDVKKKLTLGDCDTYLRLAIAYAKQQFHTEELYAYGTSFGGFMALRYIMENGNPFRKIALRCPAVNMHAVMTGTIMQGADADNLKKGKSVLVGFDRKIEVTAAFLEEIRIADIQQKEYLDYAEDILILHGTKDEVVPFEVSAKFADDNCIEFIPVENGDHRFQNPKCMEQATKAVIEFFGF